MSKLVMTPGEILRSYQQAKNKTAQVGILADLNATNRETIIEVLKEQGVHWRALVRMHSKPDSASDKKKESTPNQQTQPATAANQKSETYSSEQVDLLVAALVCYRRQTELELEKAIAQADSTMRQIDEVLRCIRSEV